MWTLGLGKDVTNHVNELHPSNHFPDMDAQHIYYSHLEHIKILDDLKKSLSFPKIKF